MKFVEFELNGWLAFYLVNRIWKLVYINIESLVIYRSQFLLRNNVLVQQTTQRTLNRTNWGFLFIKCNFIKLTLFFNLCLLKMHLFKHSKVERKFHLVAYVRDISDIHIRISFFFAFLLIEFISIEIS